MDNLTIYTDGACSGNPGPGGCACIVFNDKRVVRKSAYSNQTTNQRMEIQALLMALKLLSKPYNITIYSDSKYVINTCESWLDNWLSKGLTDKANMDLWLQYKELSKMHNINFIHVKGHSNNKYNEECDKLAVNAYVHKKGIYEIINLV